MPTKIDKSHFKQSTFGTCAYARTNPNREALTNTTKILNVHLSFEEALKLGIAVDECLRQLNRYNKAMKAGKRAALSIAVHLDQGRISIHEAKLWSTPQRAAALVSRDALLLVWTYTATQLRLRR